MDTGPIRPRGLADRLTLHRPAGFGLLRRMNTKNRWLGRASLALLVVTLAAGCHSQMGSARSQKNMTSLEGRAEKGSVQTQFDLAEIYATGRGVPRNYGEAARWYRAAAEQGHAEAQRKLGLMLKDGRGVHKDYVQAYKWLSLSAARGNSQALLSVDNVARLMSRAQIAEAQREAAAFVPRTGPAPPETAPSPDAPPGGTPPTDPPRSSP